jgi:hypothetical protein
MRARGAVEGRRDHRHWYSDKGGNETQVGDAEGSGRGFTILLLMIIPSSDEGIAKAFSAEEEDGAGEKFELDRGGTERARGDKAEEGLVECESEETRAELKADEE